MKQNFHLGHAAVLALAALFLAACASSPDHFYSLSVLPDSELHPLAQPSLPARPVHVVLGVTIPALVDRTEMVVSTSKNGISILDHERWAVTLSEQVSQTLARDIERRRSDILVGDRGFDQPASPPVKLKVDIVRMSAQRGGRATIEARWRIVDADSGTDQIGTGSFDASAAAAGDYAALAEAYSQALSALADQLAGSLPKR